MLFFNTIAVGFKEIWANKFRSVLTMLGIILGVSSLIGMSAITKGMENGMTEALIAMGGLDKVELDDQVVPVAQQHLADQRVGRTIRDVMTLKKSAPMLRLISPEMSLRNPSVTRAGKTTSPSQLVGVWPAVIDMNLHKMAEGRFFSDLDEEYASSVCVIGTGIRDDLFGSPEETGRTINPVGQLIKINDQPFTIIGMLDHYESEQDRRTRLSPPKSVDKKKSQSGSQRRWNIFWRKNHTMFIPLNSMWLRFRAATGTNGWADPTLSDIDLKVKDIKQLGPALQQARNILMLTHNGIEDFSFSTQEKAVDDIHVRIQNSRRSGGIIAAISLLVGGIGIMNIMLASITERIREIGIRKALGATTAGIFLQIIVESTVIAVLGGIAGIGCSYSLVKVLTTLTSAQDTPVITLQAVILGFAFSAAVGITAGLIPAIKAARLDPIQALRYD